MDAASPSFNINDNVDMEEEHNEQAKKFYDLLQAAKELLLLAQYKNGKDVNVTSEVTKAWKFNYDHFYPHRHKVPLSVKDLWFEKFKGAYFLELTFV
ncbi:hypothetical protein M9H77_16735 [Catharanthus roseus]|uniref:Uncharacterized protein n=1 Tax=Catharanthus roseus TaxID=4058 RepID=A0ACC0B2K4_CATRO|nr:hypothetical protein M9H77_16735 [Catharanthus roseus]